jgi:hypothetical protein
MTSLSMHNRWCHLQHLIAHKFNRTQLIRCYENKNKLKQKRSCMVCSLLFHRLTCNTEFNSIIIKGRRYQVRMENWVVRPQYLKCKLEELHYKITLIHWTTEEIVISSAAPVGGTEKVLNRETEV